VSSLQYVIVVIIIFLLQIVGAVLGFVYRDQAVEFVNDGLTSTLVLYNATADVATEPASFAITQSWDLVQTQVSCQYTHIHFLNPHIMYVNSKNNNILFPQSV